MCQKQRSRFFLSKWKCQFITYKSLIMESKLIEYAAAKDEIIRLSKSNSVRRTK